MSNEEKRREWRNLLNGMFGPATLDRLTGMNPHNPKPTLETLSKEQSDDAKALMMGAREMVGDYVPSACGDIKRLKDRTLSEEDKMKLVDGIIFKLETATDIFGTIEVEDKAIMCPEFEKQTQYVIDHIVEICNDWEHCMTLPEEEGNELALKVMDEVKRIEKSPDVEEAFRRVQNIISLCEKIRMLDDSLPQEEKDSLVSEISEGIYAIQTRNLYIQVEELTTVNDLLRDEHIDITITDDEDSTQ